MPIWYNAIIDQNQFVCAYQLSGQYGMLNRLLCYCLFIFSIANRRHLYLVAGALAFTEADLHAAIEENEGCANLSAKTRRGMAARQKRSSKRLRNWCP